MNQVILSILFATAMIAFYLVQIDFDMKKRELEKRGLVVVMGSLISGSPANFVGFYLLGWFVTKYRSWNGFILGTFVSLVLGNLIAAAGVAMYLTYVVPRWLTMMMDVKLGTIVGLTLFWTVTMLPFVLTLVPLVVAALSRSGLAIMSNGEFTYLRSGNAKGLIYPSIGVAGILAVIYALVMVTPFGDLLFVSVASPKTLFWVKSLFALPSGILIAFGIIGALLISRSTTVQEPRVCGSSRASK